MKTLNLSSTIGDKPWLDFSSLSMFMRCPRSYFWRSRMNLTSGSSNALINGKAYHEGISTYHEAKFKGISHEEAKVVALKVVEPIMAEIRDDDPVRNITVAHETLWSYFDRWRDEPYSTIETEIGFAVDLIHFVFVGKIDRYVGSPMGKMIMETKTTSIVGDRWFQRGKPNLQIDGYVSAIFINTGEMPYGGVLDVIPLHKDSSKRRDAFRIITTRVESDVDHWMRNIQEWWLTLKRYDEDGIWPMNTEMCVPLLGWSCPYSTLCDMYPDLNHSGMDIPEEYRREEWHPFEELKTAVEKERKAYDRVA